MTSLHAKGGGNALALPRWSVKLRDRQLLRQSGSTYRRDGACLACTARLEKTLDALAILSPASGVMLAKLTACILRGQRHGHVS
jgi:hypothetical protein